MIVTDGMYCVGVFYCFGFWVFGFVLNEFYWMQWEIKTALVIDLLLAMRLEKKKFIDPTFNSPISRFY